MAMSGVTTRIVPSFVPGFDDFVEGSIILRPAIGIAGTVGLDGADINLFRSQDLGPTDRDGEKMRVAEWDIGNGNARGNVRRIVVVCPIGVRFGDGDSFVGQSRTPDRAKSLVANHKAIADAETVADRLKGAPFAQFGALSVADVNGRGAMVANREGGADAGIHASAEENYIDRIIE